VRTPTYVNQYVVNRIHVHPGIAGGHDGSPDHVVLAPGTEHETVVAPTVAGFLLGERERLVYDFGGGGGWGDPLLRDPHAVLDDVWDEYVSVEAAERDYGVVISGTLEDMTLALDEEATKLLRKERSEASQ
jgi:N-methylhydantoinase B